MPVRRTPTVGDLQPFFNQLHELEKRVLNGSLQLGQVRPALQDIIEGKFGSPEPSIEMFVSRFDQLSNIRRWNKLRGWGFSEAELTERIPLDDEVVRGENGLTVSVLVPYLGSIERTFEELWTCTMAQYPHALRGDELKSDTMRLKLLDSIAHQPGLRWEVIDLGANWDKESAKSPIDVRGKDSAHAGILAAAAHFPKWVQAMDGKKVPFVWLPGYQVILPGGNVWKGVPILNWNRIDRRVYLYAGGGGYRDLSFAVPVVRAP